MDIEELRKAMDDADKIWLDECNIANDAWNIWLNAKACRELAFMCYQKAFEDYQKAKS